MDNVYRNMFEGLKQTAEGLVLASEGIKKTVEAALQAKDDHEDLREHVQRLEGMVLNQTKEIQQLRERLNGGTH